MRTFITDDGFTFYMQPNGSLTDNENPDLADLEYRSLEELEESAGKCEEIGKRTALKDATKSALESLIAQCNREIANLERFNDSRMLVATFDLQMSYERAIAAADALEAYVKDVS